MRKKKEIEVNDKQTSYVRYVLALIVSLVVFLVVKGVCVGLVSDRILCLMQFDVDCYGDIGRYPAIAFGIATFINFLPKFKYSKWIKISVFLFATVITMSYIAKYILWYQH